MRLFLGILAGLVAAIVSVFILEAIGHMIFPPPEGVDLKDPETLKTLMNDIPLGAKVAVLVAWFIGTIVGGITAGKVAQSGTLPVWILAGIMLAFIAINLFIIPHPVWMVVGAVALTGLGGFIATKFVPAKL